MIGHYLKTLFALGLMSILTALPMQIAAAAEKNVYVAPGALVKDFDKAPPEAKILFNALVGALRGETAIDAFGPVTFEYPVIENLHILDEYDYAGLDISNIQITAIDLDDTTGSKTITGVLHWHDADTYRGARTALSVVYRVIGGTIFIQDARVARMAPDAPRLLVFAVRKADAEAGLKQASAHFVDLLALVSETATPLGESAQPSDGGDDYLIFAFSLDRLGSGDRLDLLLNLEEDESNEDGTLRPPFQKLIDYSGFQVAVMEMQFDPAQSEPLRLQVYYTPTGLHPTLEPRPYLVGSFVLTD